MSCGSVAPLDRIDGEGHVWAGKTFGEKERDKREQATEKKLYIVGTDMIVRC